MERDLTQDVNIAVSHNDIVHIKKTLEEIKAQTTKTNGRVSKLENKYAMIVGGLIVVSAIVVPIFLDVVRNSN